VRERRKKDLRRAVNENVGHAHFTRGMNTHTVAALQKACTSADIQVLGELVLDDDRVVARTAAEVLSLLGDDGYTELERIARLPGEVASQRHEMILELLQPSLLPAGTPAPGSDPFEQPPRPSSPNCGPEERRVFVDPPNSVQDVARFLRYRGRAVSTAVELDDYRDAAGFVDWQKVTANVKQSKLGERTVFSLNFNPKGCSGYQIRMTDDGYTSLYGCCGK